MAGNPAGAFALLNLGGIEYAYVPNGSYLEDASAVLNPDVNAAVVPGVIFTGISVVPLSNTSAQKAQIDTPNAANSCAANQNTGVVVCTSNQRDIYVIDSASNTITSTLQSGGNLSFPFYTSGGACVTCGVTINPVTNTAIIGVSANPNTNAGMSGYQILNLADNTLGPVFFVKNSHIAEGWSVDTDRNLLLSPIANVSATQADPTGNGTGGIGPWNLTQPTQFHLFDLSQATPAQFDASASISALLNPASQLNTAAQDATGITIATQENTGNLLMTDMSQKTSSAGNPGTWSAPSKLQYLPELGPSVEFQPYTPGGPSPSLFMFGATALSIATGTHYGFMVDEFGAGAIGAFILPSTTTTGKAPEVFDYVFAALPNDPVTQAPWGNPLQPHGLAAAYANIGAGDAYGVIMNSAWNVAQGLAEADPNGVSSYTDARSSMAVISLPALLAAPRVSNCTSNSVAIASVVETGSTVTVTTLSPHGFSAGQIVNIGDFLNGYITDPLGSQSYNGAFTITSVIDPLTFTYTDSVTGLSPAAAGADLFFGANAIVDTCTPDFSGHFVDPSYDLVAHGVLRFFPIH